MNTLTPPLKRRMDPRPVIVDDDVFSSYSVTSRTRATVDDTLDNRLEKAQEELAALKAEQIAAERRREESAALEQSKKDFHSIFTQIARDSDEAYDELEREEQQLKKRQLAVREALRRLEPILTQINSIDPAVIKLSHQKAPVEQTIKRLLPLAEKLEAITNEVGKITNSTPKNSRGLAWPQHFGGWFVAGLAFTLPLILTAVGLIWWWHRLHQ